MTKADELYRLCKEAVNREEWKAHDGKTYCNYAVDYVASNMGCKDFHDPVTKVPLLADGIVDFMLRSDDWRPVTTDGTWLLANQGSLVIAGKSSTGLNEAHGHVCVLVPGDPVYSGHWEHLAPACMNVGKDNFIDKCVSYAFLKDPDYFVWKPSLEVKEEPNA